MHLAKSGCFAVSLAFLFAAPFAAVAQDLQPLEGDPLRDTRLESCAQTRGFALLRYMTPDGPVVHLSDLCLDEDEGRIVSAETRDGFTLVEKSRNGRAFEVLDSGNDKYSRLRVQLVPDEDAPGCTANGLHSLAYQIPSAKGLTVDGATALYATGYTIPATARKPMRPKTSVVLLSIRDFSQAELPRSLPQQHLPASADLYGMLDFSGDAATFSVIEGGGHTVGEAAGGLSLSVDGTGEVRASGDVTAKSQRLAGHQPHEWVSMRAEIPYLRGHVLGQTGIQLKSYGAVRGTLMDASGQEHAFRASAQLVACFKDPE
ncbi:hypothetical protein LC092_15235 [Stappia stellulata]|uniref:hypothetical protein n=1 Tax=Stappia stellulata TaxID=71235 RepID=UPI001CD5B589|nr:hypothetical protein [Stappia stellulata]MCA1243801.1 hypothetical protein [Stappia stellulata]